VLNTSCYICVNNGFCQSHFAAVIADCNISSWDSCQNLYLNDLIPHSVLRKCVLLVLHSDESTGFVHVGCGPLHHQGTASTI
jgi:hypothetical protein